MRFGSVWITSVEHLRRFGAIASAAKPQDRAPVRFEVPADFPSASPFWGFLGHKAPLAILAIGHAFLDEHVYRFEATPFRIFANRVDNARNDLRMEIPLDKLVGVESYEFRSPFMANRVFDIPFLRVRTAHTGLEADFLTCIGLTFTTVLGLSARRRKYAEALAAAHARAGWPNQPDARRPA